MAPFLCNTIFNKKTSDPLELIILAQEAAIKLNAHHLGAAGSANASASDHDAAFTNWALEIHLGQLKEARFTMDPNNNKLQVFSDFRHAKYILPPLGTMGAPGATSISGYLEHKVFKSLGEGLKRIGEAEDEANLLKCKEIKLQGDKDDKKKDRIKDMHPSIFNMILMASAVNHNIQGEYAEFFKAFYNSKNHRCTDMELNHQFDTKGFHNMGFAEGTVLALWSGLLKRLNPTAPSNCNHFAFQELQPAIMNQKSRSLICTMINQKGGLAQSAEEIKMKTKQDVAAPADYTEMIFQLQAFVALIEIPFGEKSIAASKLKRFIHLIKVNSIFYKGCMTLDDFFPSKVLWSVCTCFQLFLNNCTHTEESEDVDDSLINFLADHRDIILDWFGATLPPCFKKLKNNKVTNKDSDTEIEKGKNNKKQKKEETKSKKKECQAEDSDLEIKNKNQCADLKKYAHRYLYLTF
jgi:hypothetical protein